MVILENFDSVFIVFLFSKLLGRVCILLMVVWNLNRIMVMIRIVIIGVLGLVMVSRVGSIIR